MRAPSPLTIILIAGCSLLAVLLQLASCTDGMPRRTEADTSARTNSYSDLLKEDWSPPDTLLLGDDDQSRLIKYGRELIMHTGKYFGPSGSISKKANGMSCQNCHLKAGTQLWANSFSAVFANYPKVRPRSGMLEDLHKRIDDCMERSMNGDKLDADSRELKAMTAYINWVGKDVPKDSTPKGASVTDLKYLDHPADSIKGKIVFEANCVLCHGHDGKGQLAPDGSYLYPPLWGDHSYNTAAGMYRISRLASFVKSNMPYLKSTHDKPLLTDEEAWDVAAYICSKPRPEKNFVHDWPDIAQKPIDHPFGPYADKFSEEQHKYGPFAEIKEFYKNKNNTQKSLTVKNK